MLKKVLGIAIISSLFLSSALAEDFLAKVTNGAVSDYDEGVRRLSAEEERQVVGGYVVRDFGSSNEWYGVAFYTINELQKGGLCSLGVESCAGPSQGRLRDYLYITNGSLEFFPVYIVKRNIGTSRNGRYVYFTYGTGMLDRNMQLYKFGQQLQAHT